MSWMSHQTWGLATSNAGDDWRQSAACRPGSGVDPELFFPLGGAPRHRRMGVNLAHEKQAKSICSRCPAREDCRTWATRTGQEYGIWGGLNEGERRGMRPPKAHTGRREGVCVRCGKSRELRGRGLCGSCHSLLQRQGHLDRYPSAADRVPAQVPS